MATPKDKVLYEKVKKMADEIYKKSSAYKSGYIVKKYKELGGEYIDDKKHGKGTLILQGSTPNFQKVIEGEWDSDFMNFNKAVKLVVKEASTGKTISTFEGMVDQHYNPIIHN